MQGTSDHDANADLLDSQMTGCPVSVDDRPLHRVSSPWPGRRATVYAQASLIQ